MGVRNKDKLNIAIEVLELELIGLLNSKEIEDYPDIKEIVENYKNINETLKYLKKQYRKEKWKC